MNKEKIKLSDKELQKCLDELQGTNFLNAFCVLDWILKTREEIKELHNKIDKAIEWVRDWTHNPNDWFEIDSKPSELLEILKDSDVDE